MSSSPAKKPRILIVEDVALMRLYLEELVSRMPEVQVLGAVATGPEARRWVSKERPDWILLDEVLPGESSVDLLQYLAGQGLKVVLISGMETLPEELPAGAVARIRKPGWEGGRNDEKQFKTDLILVLSR